MNSKQRFLSYLKGQKKSIAFLSFSVLGFLLANLSQPLFVGLALDDALAGNQASFVLILSLSLAFSLLGGVLDFFFEYSVSRMTQEVIFGIRKDVFCKYNSVSIGFLFGKKDGDMLQLEIGDIENVANGLFSAFKSLVEGILTILITIILIFSLNWILALSVILLTPLSFFVSRFVARFSRKYFRKQAGLMSGLNEVSMEALGNSDLLAALDAKESSEEGFARKNEVLKNESRIALFSASWTNPTTRLVNNTIYALVGIGGIVLIGLTRDQNATLLSLGALMTIGRLSSFLSYTNQYTKPFNEISGVVGDYEQAASSFHRISAFLDTEDDIDSGTKEVEDIQSIRFDHMYFSYEKGKKLIEDFSETIHKGEKVAIVGPTGAGKTTLINVLMRFYDPTKGKILYNGIDGEEIGKASLRKNFGMVLQETWVFHGTVRENVRYGKRDATDAEVEEACKEANADSFIQTLPEGYDTVISAKSGLSDGERQMLSIARVLLAKPDIVILDEATSNVDTRTEMKITEAFQRLLDGRTSITIAHRLSTIRNSDVIYVLKDGSIVETGSHAALMGKKGFYYSLYSSQFKK